MLLANDGRLADVDRKQLWLIIPRQNPMTQAIYLIVSSDPVGIINDRLEVSIHDKNYWHYFEV